MPPLNFMRASLSHNKLPLFHEMSESKNDDSEKIYVLECENGKFYVGRSRNLPERLSQHFQGNFGAVWTRLHKPLNCVHIETCPDPLLEDMVVKQYCQ